MAYQYESNETRALKSIQSKNYPDTNKDFTRNVQRLNSSVDYISSYMIVMQKGIDDANQNFLEQIQGFFQDLWVLFAGGEPTGIDMGDLKYVFQALGALFGFDGSPFPFNLVHAAEHMFTNFLAISIQFTDVIFDTIFAWADQLGVDPDFTGVLRDAYDKAIEALNTGRNIIEQLAGVGGAVGDMMAGIGTYIYHEFIQPIIDFISRSVGGPIGKALDWIQTSISKIFNLASGADAKASLLIKKAVPLWESLDGNGETSLALSTADALLVINSTNSRGAFISCRGGDLKQTISIIASKTGTVASFNLDVYSLNASNGADLIYSSPDLSSALVAGSGNETVVFHEMTDDHAFTTNQNSYYYVMMRMTGSGSINIQGRVFPVANTAVRPLYPGLLRNPTGSVNPSNIVSTTLDGYYVKETPYAQLGTIDDITPQSFYFDFSSLTTNLWYFKTFFTGGLGNVKKLAVTGDGKLYFPGGGANGFSAITHKYNVGTNRCRVGMFLAEAPSTRATTMYMFSKLDLSSYVALRIFDTGTTFGDSGELCIGTAINTMTVIPGTIPATVTYWNRWVWLEYDPDEAKYYVLIDPDFEDPNYRNSHIDIVPGACVAVYEESLNPSLAAIEKSSTSRSGGIIMLQSSGGVNSAMVDDMKLEDYMLM